MSVTNSKCEDLFYTDETPANKTAEAFMSLGNVSSPRNNERHFHRALRLLRAAAATPDYSLNRYLQQYVTSKPRLLTRVDADGNEDTWTITVVSSTEHFLL